MESIAFKEEEKEGGGKRKQVKGKTASLSHILFFFQAQRAGENPGSRQQQGAALPSTGQKKNTLDPTIVNENLTFLRSSTHRPSEKGCGSQAA